MLARIWGKRNPHTLLVGMKISTITMENNIQALQKTKNRTAYDPVIPLLGLYLKGCESAYNKAT
jgi:hypothetical protein